MPHSANPPEAPGQMDRGTGAPLGASLALLTLLRSAAALALAAGEHGWVVGDMRWPHGSLTADSAHEGGARTGAAGFAGQGEGGAGGSGSRAHGGAIPGRLQQKRGQGGTGVWVAPKGSPVGVGC